MKQSLRKSHGTIWKVFAVLIPAIIILAIYVKQDASKLEPPVQISPAASGDGAATTGSGS